MKVVLNNVTASIALPANGQPHPGMPGPGANGRMNGGPALNRSHEGPGLVNGTSNVEGGEPSLEDMDAARCREIESKAATGIILLLLKWLKISRKHSCDIRRTGLTRPHRRLEV
jgi:hypothetical protein